MAIKRCCPVCHQRMPVIELEGEKVDKCPDNHGYFFDCGELEKIVRIVKLFNEVSLSEEDIDTSSDEEKERMFSCPDADGEMKKIGIAGMTIDVCEECGGIWLDNGEISALKIAENHVLKNIKLYLRLA